MTQVSWESLLIWLSVRVGAEHDPLHSNKELTQSDIRERQRIQLELHLAREKQRAFLASHNQFML